MNFHRTVQLLAVLATSALAACASKNAPADAAKAAQHENVEAQRDAACPSDNPWNVRVGAIRWDAWYGDTVCSPNSHLIKVTWSLSPREFWNRLPFFSKIDDGGLLPIDGNDPAVMRKELAYARRAGVDYWAFLDYPDGGLTRGIELYLAEPAGPVHFSLILSGGVYGSYAYALNQVPRLPNSSADWFARTLRRLLDERYETVLDGRPLVFVQSDVCAPGANGSYPYCSPWLFNELEKQLVARGRKRPYYVYLSTDPESAGYFINYLKLDALSVYAVVPGMVGLDQLEVDYTEFQHRVRVGYEDRMRSAAVTGGFDVVPFASTGWDPSPRFNCGDRGLDCYQCAYGCGDHPRVKLATGPQVSEHLRSVAEWAAYHASSREGLERATSPARTILAYAWNEFDEGGWLAPTLAGDHVTPNTERVDSMNRLFRGGCGSVPGPVGPMPTLPEPYPVEQLEECRESCDKQFKACIDDDPDLAPDPAPAARINCGNEKTVCLKACPLR